MIYAMEGRIPMNTTSLQKHFKTEYEDFFAKNDLVLSACHSLPWNLGFGWDKNKIHIKQKVALKTFMGISITNEQKVKFDTIKLFEVCDTHFEEMTFKEINKQYKEIENKIMDVLKDFWYTKGITIKLLSESPRWYGLGFSWIVWSLLATTVYLLTGKVSLEDMEDYDEFVLSDIFKEIFLLASKIDYISKYHNSAGHNCYAAMMNTSLPTITFCEDYDVKKNDMDFTPYAYKIKDFLWISNQLEELHLDYGVIFSWVKNKVENNNQIFLNTEDEFESLQEKMIAILKNNDFKDLDKFAFKDIFQKWFLITLKDTFFVYNFKLLQAFKDLLGKWFDEAIIHNFIQTVKENNALGSLFETDNKISASMLWQFDYLKKFDDEILGIFPISTTKMWGSLVFVMKPHKSRDTIIKTIEKLQDIWYTDLRLEYASWIDGTCADGIKIEQWIDTGIFSDYIQKDQVYYKNNQWESLVWNYNEVFTNKKDGLVLDMINNKMHLNGKKLTSSDLCSQTTTINILYKLMENIWEDVANKKFEISSYSKNKNEMLGKIVLPLISLIEKETGEKFPLICKGSIHDFYMKLNPSIIKLAIIKKM